MAPPKRKQELLPELFQQQFPPPDPSNDGGEVIQEFNYEPQGGRQINRTGRPRTRPHVFDPHVIEEIETRLIMGEGLKAILKDNPRMPTPQQVYLEMARNPDGDFNRRITRARLAAQQAIMDHCDHLARSATPENYNAIKTTISWFQWHAGKLMPMTYGDKIQLDHRTRVPMSS